MKTPITPQGLPPADREDGEGLEPCYSAELVEQIVSEALAAQAATIEAICKIIECAGPDAAGEIADLLGYPSVEWPSDQAASSPEQAVDAVDELREALRGLLASGGVIADASPDELQAALSDPESEPIVKTQAAAVLRARAALQASRQPQAQQGVAAPLELKVCHSQNASQTPQADLSLTAAPQEWSPAYTRGPARQSAPVAAVPAMVQLTEEQMVSAVRPLCNTDQVAERLVAVSIDEYRAIEAAIAKLNGLTVGDGAHSGALHCKKTWWEWAGTREHAHGRATYYCNTVNETTVSLPNFEQALALAMAIEAQARETRQEARHGMLQEIGRIEP